MQLRSQDSLKKKSRGKNSPKKAYPLFHQAILNESVNFDSNLDWKENINQPLGQQSTTTGSPRNVRTIQVDFYPLEEAVKTNNLALVQLLFSNGATLAGDFSPSDTDPRIRVLLDLNHYILDAPGKSGSKVTTAKTLFELLRDSEPVQKSDALKALKETPYGADLSSGRLGDIFQAAERAFANEKPSLSRKVVKGFFMDIKQEQIQEAQQKLAVHPDLCNQVSQNTYEGYRWMQGGGRVSSGYRLETYKRHVHPLEYAVEKNNVAMVKLLLTTKASEQGAAGAILVNDPNDYAYRLATGDVHHHPNRCASGKNKLTPNPEIVLLLQLHHYIKLREVEADFTGLKRAFSCFSIFKFLLPTEDKTVKAMKLELATELLGALCDDNPQAKLTELSKKEFIKDGKLGELFKNACKKHSVALEAQQTPSTLSGYL